MDSHLGGVGWNLTVRKNQMFHQQTFVIRKWLQQAVRLSTYSLLKFSTCVLLKLLTLDKWLIFVCRMTQLVNYEEFVCPALINIAGKGR